MMEGREVVVVEAVRTAIGRGHPEKGMYKDVHANELLGVTVLHGGRLHLRIDPRRDGGPWLADVASLAAALTEAEQRLAAY